MRTCRPARGRWIRPGLALALAASFVATFVAFPAHADPSAIAEKLFQEGRRLLGEGKTQEACDKFQKSQDVEPSAGTLLNLAACREKNGQLASAWKAFSDARIAARARKRADWEENARSKAAELEPRVPRLLVHTKDQNVQITLDGTPLSPKELDIEMPVDPGVHLVSAKAPGGAAWSEDARAVEGKLVRIEVPIFAAESRAGTANATSGARDAGNGAAVHRALGFSLLGVGIIGVGLGVVTGFMASSSLSDAEEKCPLLTDGNAQEPVPCNRDAIRDNDSARTFGTVSTVSFIAGGAFAAGGAALLLLAPKTKEHARLTPLVGPGLVGTTLHVRF